MTDTGLISQAYRSSSDGMLLRPSRPLSAVDSAFLNVTASGPCTGAACNVSSVRGTHSAVPVLAHNNSAVHMLITHYIVSWGTRPATTLQSTDLYPSPRGNVSLGMREHIFDPSLGQEAGCVAGRPASHGCISLLDAVAPRIVPETKGGQVRLTVFYEPLSNGAYLLGELTKFVHVSPQRFGNVQLGGSSPCGFRVEVLGEPREVVKVVAVDGGGIVRVTQVEVANSGRVVVAL